MKIIFSRIILILFLIFNSLMIFSQEENIDTNITAEEIGNELFNKAKKFLETNPDSTEYYTRLALPIFEAAENWKMYVASLNQISICLYLKGDHEKFYDYIHKSTGVAKKHLPPNSNESNDALSILAACFIERGQFKKAIETYEMIYDREKDSKDIDRRGSTLGSLGYTYLKIGDLEQSLNHYHQAIEIWKDTTGFLRLGNEARINNRIGNYYFEHGKIDSAIARYQVGLKKITHSQLKTGKIQDRVEINLLLDLAEAYILKKEYQLAKAQIEHAQFLPKATYLHNQGFVNELLGRIFLEKNQTSLAIQYFKKSKETAQQEFKAYKKHPLIAEKDIWIGKSYLKTKNHHAALFQFHAALNSLCHDSLDLDISQNPKLENIFAKKMALQALSQKAKTQFLIFKKEKNTSFLKQAYDSYFLATQLIQNLRQDYLAEGSKQNLSSDALPIFEAAIEVAIICFEQTKDSLYLNQAFAFSENNKANILLESINDNSAKGFSGIPKDLLAEEENLRTEIAFYKKLKNELQTKSKPNDEKLKKLDKQLFEEQKKYQQLIAKFEQDFPKYFHLKYATQLATAKDIQSNFLNPKQILIEYFWGKKNIYVFTITATQLKIKTINRTDQIHAAIFDVIDLITHPPSNHKIDFQNFIHQSNFLFEQLLKKSLPAEISEIIIVPDDILNYLPFDVLLTQKPNNTITSYSIANLDYLLKYSTINYSLSATLLLNHFEKPKTKSTYDFVGFAPSFDDAMISRQRSCNQNKLSSLHCNKDEIKRIEKLIEGEIFIDDEAHLDNFYQNAVTSNILHLATHACVDDKNPLFNKIHLADDYISNNELYNLSLNAELVVLSACNTGSGKLAKGEGVMSLSRGFIHAGSRSVVMSLWSVDDCATSDIMVDFYKNLKIGKTKSEALRLSKINFISNAKKAQQHPYYWAAFVQIGDSTPISFTPLVSTYYYFIFGLCLLILFIYFLNKIKYSSL